MTAVDYVQSTIRRTQLEKYENLIILGRDEFFNKMLKL